MIDIIAKKYLTSKRNELPDSTQDACKYNPALLRYAVADGATREFFSGKLAKGLVDLFCADNDVNINIFETKEYQKWLQTAQEVWVDFLDSLIKRKKVNFVVKNRYNRKDSGASTFVGIEFNIKNSSFKAMIIGDSCLFHIRDDKIYKCHLIDDYKSFDNSPDFFFSRNKEKFIEPTTIIDGNFKEGDYFILATDAISKWLLYLHQEKIKKWENIWNSLLKEKKKDEYDSLIEEARKDKDNKLDDDDVTLLILATSEENKLSSFDVDDAP